MYQEDVYNQKVYEEYDIDDETNNESDVIDATVVGLLAGKATKGKIERLEKEEVPGEDSSKEDVKEDDVI